MAPDLVIYGLKGSPFVRKVQIFLAEKGVEFELEAASPFQPKDWFLEISPAKRMPVLRDRSVGEQGIAGTLPDSSIICSVEKQTAHPRASQSSNGSGSMMSPTSFVVPDIQPKEFSRHFGGGGGRT